MMHFKNKSAIGEYAAGYHVGKWGLNLPGPEVMTEPWRRGYEAAIKDEFAKYQRLIELRNGQLVNS